MNENRARLRARLLIVLLHILLQCNRGWCLNFSLGASPVLGIGAVLFKPRGTSVLLSLGDGELNHIVIIRLEHWNEGVVLVSTLIENVLFPVVEILGRDLVNAGGFFTDAFW